MNEIWQRLRELYRARSQQEQLLLALAGALIGFLFIYSLILSPLRARNSELDSEVSTLNQNVKLAAQLAGQISRLQTELHSVEELIKTKEQVDLFTLLERLAEEADVKNQLEEIKPATPSKNDHYPETRVQVKLTGATLAQTVNFLYHINIADLHLIIRSVRIRTRRDDSKLLDVDFSVSSFERA